MNKYIDRVENWIEKLHDSSSINVLTEREKKHWDTIPMDKKEKYVSELIEKPIVFENPETIYDWYFRNKWADALKTVHNEDSISVFEIGAGGCDIVPKAIARDFVHHDTYYVTANLNKELSQIFKWKTEHDPISIYLIEDYASNIKNHVGDKLFDVIAFEHSANDVLETILAEKHGIDTVNKSWMDILPSITELVNSEWDNNTFEDSTRDAFMRLISVCFDVLKPGGYIVIAHYQFQYNLDIGLSADFNTNLIPMVRKWLAENKIGTEEFFDEFDSNWWMFIRK